MKNFIAYFIPVLLLSCQSFRPETQEVSKNRALDEVTLAFVGDVILHQRLRKREETTNEGYQIIWSKIQDYLQKADLTYANLEGPVAPDIGGVSGYPMFNYPEKIISSLKDSGFDVVSTANNHALDRGSAGVQKTIENLKKSDLNYTGTRSGPSESETWWTLTEVPGMGGKYIAWLACTEMTNGHRDKKQQVLYCFKDREVVQKSIQHLKSRDDVLAILITPHWGEEDRFSIEPARRQWAHEMLDIGGTAVIGAHPHVLQTIEKYESMNKKKTAIVYSLGNFISNQREIKNRLSLMVFLKLESAANSKMTVKEIKAVPLWMNRTLDKDRTAKYRIEAVWNFSGLPDEARKIWNSQIDQNYVFKNQEQLEDFLEN